MRKAFEDELLRVIRRVVTGTECGEVAEIKVNNELFAFAERHQLEHLVGYLRFADGDTEQGMPFMTSLSLTTQQASAAIELSRAFSDEMIPHILLKGTVLRKLYPEEWMRNGCDVDVLVQPCDLDRAGRVLCGLGYEDQKVVTVHDVGYHRDPLRIELHYKLIEDYRIPKVAEMLENIWTFARPTEERDPYALSLPDEVFYLYQVAHMAKHFGDGGCGIRALLDLWVLNHRCEYDRDTRLRLLCTAGMADFEKMMLRISEYWFAGGDGEDLEFIERFILDGGAYGASENGRAVQMVRKGRLGYLCSRLFMPYSELARKYPTLEKHPYLLPVYEVRRWFSALGRKRGEYVSELKDDLCSTEEKKNIDKMLETLGLSELR